MSRLPQQQLVFRNFFVVLCLFRIALLFVLLLFFVVCMCVYVFTYALFCTVIGASAISSSRQSGRPWQVRHAGDRWYSHNYDGSPVFKLIVTARKLNGCEKSSAEIIKTEHRDFRGKNSSYFACPFFKILNISIG